MTISKEVIKNVEMDVNSVYEDYIKMFLEGVEHGALITFTFITDSGLLKDDISNEELVEKFDEYLKSIMETITE